MRMRVGREALIGRALAVVDETVEACRAGPVTPSLGLHFALAFLYACSNGDANPYREFLATIRDDYEHPNLHTRKRIRHSYSVTYRTAIARSVGAVP